MNANVVISSCLALAGLWVLWLWLYRDYRTDAFREEVFALRERLFDLQAELKKLERLKELAIKARRLQKQKEGPPSATSRSFDKDPPFRFWGLSAPASQLVTDYAAVCRELEECIDGLDTD